VTIPTQSRKISIASRDYRLYKKRIEKRLSWYERLARIAEKLMKASFDKKTEEELALAIDFTGLRITPKAPFSLLLITIVLFSLAGGFLFAFALIPVFGVILTAILGLGIGYYLFRYPINLMKAMRIKASSQVVLAILYMVVSMRISPNLERALRFTASNITGALAWDMRRVIWDIEMGKYYSANEALTDYIAKWKPENEEFSESLRLIRESQRQVPEKAEKILDEALRVVLEGTRDRMKHYAQDLQMPVTMIHMMGIVLPILGSVMAPMVAVFMAEMVTPWHFLIGYDIALPIVLLWFINNVLSKRPVTFSKVDISKHPELPPSGSYMIKSGRSRASIPVFPIALLIGILIMLPAIYYFAENPGFLMTPVEIVDGLPVFQDVEDPDPLYSLSMSILAIMAVGITLAVFFIMSNVQRSRIENAVYKMESEFELALFQLGNRISGGTPLEMAVEKAKDDVKDLEIANLFEITLRNMRNFGLTFETALTHPKVGALRYYPSRLIQNVMRTVTDTAKRGVQYASESMLTVSRYLRSVRETQEYMRSLMAETTSSMQFQAYAMAPLVSGLIVAMSQVIIQVLVFLGRRMNEIGFEAVFGIDASEILGTSSAITSTMFQIIIGIYLIEVIIILAVFVTKINRGEDKVMQWYSAGKIIIVALMIYFLVAIGTSLLFGGMIEGAMQSIVSS
jgi:MFS family permease